MSRNARHILWSLHVSESETYTHFVKKMGEKYVRTSMFVALVITSLGLALQTSRAIVLASAE